MTPWRFTDEKAKRRPLHLLRRDRGCRTGPRTARLSLYAAGGHPICARCRGAGGATGQRVAMTSIFETRWHSPPISGMCWRPISFATRSNALAAVPSQLGTGTTARPRRRMTELTTPAGLYVGNALTLTINTDRIGAVVGTVSSGACFGRRMAAACPPTVPSGEPNCRPHRFRTRRSSAGLLGDRRADYCGRPR